MPKKRKITFVKYASFREAERAEVDNYKMMTPEDKLKELFYLLSFNRPDRGRIKKEVKKYKLADKL